jgi:hypothetical protein
MGSLARFGHSPLGLLIVTIGVRLAYVLVFEPPFHGVYWDLATSLVRDRTMTLDGVVDSQFEPLYPLFLAGIRMVIGDQPAAVQMVQVVVVSLGGLALHHLALALDGRPQLAAIAAGLYAVDPLLVRHAGAASDLGLAATALIVFAYAFVRGVSDVRIVLAGGALGLAVLTRSSAVLLAPLCAIVLLHRRRVRAAGLFLIAAAVFSLPLVARSYVVSGSVWPTRSGLNLYIGNSPYTAVLLPNHDLDLLEEYAAADAAAELGDRALESPDFRRAVDVALTRHAVSYMAAHPLRTLGEKVRNLGHLLSPRLVPFFTAADDTRAIDRSGELIVENARRRPAIEHIAYSAFFTPVLIAALIGVYVRRARLGRDAVLWCVAASVVTVHAIYSPATRYRAPMEFVLLFYAAAALSAGLGVRQERLRRGQDAAMEGHVSGRAGTADAERDSRRRAGTAPVSASTTDATPTTRPTSEAKMMAPLTNMNTNTPSLASSSRRLRLWCDRGATHHQTTSASHTARKT